MESLLITQSLLSAWNYLFAAREGGEEKAEEDFMRTLRREPSETSEAMQKGINFESLCYQIADGKFNPDLGGYPETYEGASKIASLIKGGQYQVRLSDHIEVGGLDFLLYGILDVLRAGVIYDIKFKTKSIGSIDTLAGSYFESAQHPAYLYLVPEAIRFEYLVSDGIDLYKEVYRREDTRKIGDIIEEFSASIKRMGLWDLYTEKWKSRY